MIAAIPIPSRKIELPWVGDFGGRRDWECGVREGGDGLEEGAVRGRSSALVLGEDGRTVVERVPEDRVDFDAGFRSEVGDELVSFERVRIVVLLPGTRSAQSQELPRIERTHHTMSVIPHSAQSAGRSVVGGPRTTKRRDDELSLLMLSETSCIESSLPKSLSTRETTQRRLGPTGTATDWLPPLASKRSAD